MAGRGAGPWPRQPGRPHGRARPRPRGRASRAGRRLVRWQPSGGHASSSWRPCLQLVAAMPPARGGHASSRSGVHSARNATPAGMPFAGIRPETALQQLCPLRRYQAPSICTQDASSVPMSSAPYSQACGPRHTGPTRRGPPQVKRGQDLSAARLGRAPIRGRRSPDIGRADRPGRQERGNAANLEVGRVVRAAGPGPDRATRSGRLPCTGRAAADRRRAPPSAERDHRPAPGAPGAGSRRPPGDGRRPQANGCRYGRVAPMS